MRATPLLAAVILLGAVTASSAAPSPAGTLPPAGEGRRLFMKYNCYSCHGLFAGGGMGPNLRGEAEAGDVREAIQHGEDKGMRSFSSYFSSTDTDNMVAYMRSLGTKSEPTFVDWWVANPTK